MSKPTVKKFRTVVRKEEVVLPGDITYLYQSNRVTNARFADFNLLTAKTFVHIIYQLQPAIRGDMNGKNWTQLNLFEVNKHGSIAIPIVISDIVGRGNYKGVLEAVTGLMKTVIKIKSPYKEGYNNYTGLIDSYDEPRIVNNRSTIYVYIKQEIADNIIRVNAANSTKIGQHTKFLYEVVMASTSKYTWRIYQLIESWKAKGGFRINYESFRDMIGVLPNEYKTFSLFKRDVLQKVQMDIEKKADCWFNCAATDFVQRKGKKVDMLNFKVIVPVMEEEYQMHYNNAMHLLKTQLGFSESHLNAVKGIFSAGVDFSEVRGKILDIKLHVDSNRSIINDVPSYALTSLKNHFLE